MHGEYRRRPGAEFTFDMLLVLFCGFLIVGFGVLVINPGSITVAEAGGVVCLVLWPQGAIFFVFSCHFVVLWVW